MGLAEHRVLRHGRAVFAGKKGFQHLACFHYRSGQFRFGQFKIGNVSKFLKALYNFHCTQALFRKLPYQAVEGQIVHRHLIKCLIPDAEAGPGDLHLSFRRLRDGVLAKGHRAGALIADAMAGVTFGENFIGIPCLGAAGEGDEAVLFVNGTGLCPIDPHQHFFGAAERKDHPLALQLGRNDNTGFEPGVFPLFAPLSRHRVIRPFDRIIKAQMVHGGEIRKSQRRNFPVIMLRKLLRPDS